MIISSPYNRFLHGVVYKEIKEIQEPLRVFDGSFVFRPSGLSLDSVKQILKYLDKDYPRYNDIPLSITQLTSKQMHEHCEFITLLLSENGITQSHIEEEWKRLMERVSDYK